MAPANRVDLLVKAPMNADTRHFDVRIQQVMARSSVKPTPIKPTENDPMPGSVLLTVDVEGPALMRDDQPTEMPFLTESQFPERPNFLADISDDELKLNNYITRTLVFNSKDPGTKGGHQHTINDLQFAEGQAHLNILLGTTEEWTIKNTTTNGSGLNSNIDHPLHIHINPFQVTEFFDPNENLVDPATGKLEAVLQDGTTKGVPHYVTNKAQLTDPNNPFAKRQCYIDPANQSTWSVTGARSMRDVNGERSVSGPCVPQDPPESKSIWRDVFAIPSGLRLDDGNVIPGYYKMRSRFVDYPGLYVMHCHILIHEDRGMMFSVEVLKTKPAPVRHH
jgi:FtsP/CotA-like multicopper oxidase with cupredoxin domain